jgi:Na+/H+ antiporter NhaD/arsenite permease-like protein
VRADQILGCASLAATSRARRPLVLLAAIVLVAGSFSAFLVNDTICLVMTPLVLDLVTQIDRDPIPYLLAVAMRLNVGSTATITGNPQNMITALASWGARIRTWEWRNQNPPVPPLISTIILKNPRISTRFQAIG